MVALTEGGMQSKGGERWSHRDEEGARGGHLEVGGQWKDSWRAKAHTWFFLLSPAGTHPLEHSMSPRVQPPLTSSSPRALQEAPSLGRLQQSTGGWLLCSFPPAILSNFSGAFRERKGGQLPIFGLSQLLHLVLKYACLCVSVSHGPCAVCPSLALSPLSPVYLVILSLLVSFSLCLCFSPGLSFSLCTCLCLYLCPSLSSSVSPCISILNP